MVEVDYDGELPSKVEHEKAGVDYAVDDVEYPVGAARAHGSPAAPAAPPQMKYALVAQGRSGSTVSLLTIDALTHSSMHLDNSMDYEILGSYPRDMAKKKHPEKIIKQYFKDKLADYPTSPTAVY